jgi:hypothetical protein
MLTPHAGIAPSAEAVAHADDAELSSAAAAPWSVWLSNERRIALPAGRDGTLIR